MLIVYTYTLMDIYTYMYVDICRLIYTLDVSRIRGNLNDIFISIKIVLIFKWKKMHKQQKVMWDSKRVEEILSIHVSGIKKNKGNK